MKKIVLLLAALALVCASASAQNILESLGRRAKNAVENNIGRKVEKGVNDVLDGKVGNNNQGNNRRNNRNNNANEEVEEVHQHEAAAEGWTCPECGHEGNTGKFCEECGAKQPTGEAATWDCPECGHKGNTGKFCEECGAQQSTVASAKTEEVKSDFVRGSVILFQDDFKNEQVGEFPSKWDIQGDGSAETAVINGQKYLSFTTEYNFVEPLMENMKSYLPDVFTLEWDVFCSKGGDYGSSEIQLIFDMGDNDRVGEFGFTYRSDNPDGWTPLRIRKPNSEDTVYGANEWEELKSIIKVGQWNHFAVSFNKRALKIYINDNRVVNLPNVQAPERFKFWCGGDYKYKGFTNVLLCAGAKELYGQETTNLSEAAKAVEQAIAQTGKFVTNNILFDTGKATIKPESEPEIDKVAEYMKANPTARFEVQGHTDSQGSDKVNDPLSQERAEAVVKALEAKGVDPFNLRAVGKGSHEPVADNSTDAGRAQNRRVEFIKK